MCVCGGGGGGGRGGEGGRGGRGKGWDQKVLYNKILISQQLEHFDEIIYGTKLSKAQGKHFNYILFAICCNALALM